MFSSRGGKRAVESGGRGVLLSDASSAGLWSCWGWGLGASPGGAATRLLTKEEPFPPCKASVAIVQPGSVPEASG